MSTPTCSQRKRWAGQVTTAETLTAGQVDRGATVLPRKKAMDRAMCLCAKVSVFELSSADHSHHNCLHRWYRSGLVNMLKLYFAANRHLLTSEGEMSSSTYQSIVLKCDATFCTIINFQMYHSAEFPVSNIIIKLDRVVKWKKRCYGKRFVDGI